MEDYFYCEVFCKEDFFNIKAEENPVQIKDTNIYVRSDLEYIYIYKDKELIVKKELSTNKLPFFTLNESYIYNSLVYKEPDLSVYLEIIDMNISGFSYYFKIGVSNKIKLKLETNNNIKSIALPYKYQVINNSFKLTVVYSKEFRLDSLHKDLIPNGKIKVFIRQKDDNLYKREEYLLAIEKQANYSESYIHLIKPTSELLEVWNSIGTQLYVAFSTCYTEIAEYIEIEDLRYKFELVNPEDPSLNLYKKVKKVDNKPYLSPIT